MCVKPYSAPSVGHPQYYKANYRINYRDLPRCLRPESSRAGPSFGHFAVFLSFIHALDLLNSLESSYMIVQLILLCF